jgi:hypothetical protein
MKCILHCLWGTLDFGLLLQRSVSFEVMVYIDADWAGCPDTRYSILGYAMFFSNNLISWSSKHQNVISHSRAEAEYWVVANGVAEACWL